MNVCVCVSWMCVCVNVCPHCLTSCTEERQSPACTVVQAACLIIQLWPPHLFSSSSLQSFLSGSHSFISVSLPPSLCSLLSIPAVPDPPCSSSSSISPFSLAHTLVSLDVLSRHLSIWPFFFFSPPLSSLTFPDGVHSISAPCVLRVLIITEDMLGSSVTVRLQNMSQEHFLSPLLGNFLEGVSAVLSVPVEDVFIFNIQPDLDAAPGGILNVSFSAALPGGLFFPSEALEEQLYLNRLRLTSLTQMEVRSHLQLWIHIPNTYCSALWNPRPTQEQKYYGIFTSSDHSATCLHSWTHVQQLAIRGPCNRTCRAKVIRHIVQTHMHLKRCSPEHIAHELMIQYRCHASAAIWDHGSNTPIWALSCMKSHTPGHSKHISNTHALHN